MQSMIRKKKTARLISFMLAFSLTIGTFCLNGSTTEAKGSLSSGDCVKNVLVYVENSAGQQVLAAQLSVNDMVNYLNSNVTTCGAVHNYSVLDKYVTPVHQEAQGFTVPELMDYAESKSSLADLDMTFSGSDSVGFWEIDDNGFDTADTYTYNSLYGVNRYNFPALYQQWNYTNQTYLNNTASKSAIWASRQTETPLLSITAYTERYILETAKYNSGDYNMEGYFDSCGLLDTAKTMRLMLPMTESDFTSMTSTASDSRYGISYILLNMASAPEITAGTVAKPTYTFVDGDASTSDDYEAGYCYFTLDCDTAGANIYYNDCSVSTYMPTALYTAGQEIKVAKQSGVASLKIRAVKDGCVDAGVQTATNIEDETYEETVDPDADVWDGVSTEAAIGVTEGGVYTIEIDTCAQLKWIADQVNNVDGTGSNSFAGTTIRLGNNLHLNDEDWRVIGDNKGTLNQYQDYYIDDTYTFSGTFDGNGYTISGLNPVSICEVRKGVSGRCGLFGSISDAVIKDLTVSGVAATCEQSGIGGIAGEAAGSTFDNCTSYVRIKANPDYPLVGYNRGGIAGTASGCTITDCVNYGKISGYVNAGYGFGGIVGKTTGGTVTGCENYGSISCSSDGYCGGIIGYGKATAGVTGDGSAANCTNYGAVAGGGIIGNGNASYCVNFGDISGDGITNEGSVSRCINNGTVAGSGIAGKGSVDSCVNTGSTVNGLIGGGRYGSSSVYSSLTNSYNLGSASNAGLAGSLYTSVGNCYNADDGAALGAYTYGAITLSNIYYLNTGTEIAGDASRDISTILPKTAAQMQAAAFLSTLNSNAGSAVFAADTTGISSGFPKFTWETGVIFEENNGTTCVPWHLIPGTLCPEPADPTRSGYTFTCWCSDEELTTAYDFSDPVNSDTILYAGWQEKDAAAQMEKEIILSWSGDPTTTQTVTWHDDASAGYVQYVSKSSYTDTSSFTGSGQATATLTTLERTSSSSGGDSQKQYYQATITGLSPNTTYCYRVGSEGNWSDVYTFTTAKARNKSFAFMYLGDVQYSSDEATEYKEWGTMLEEASSANPDLAFGLIGGDMVENGGSLTDWSYFLSYAGNVFSKIPMMTANGNHESNFTGGKPLYYTEIMGLPQNGPDGFSEEFYSFDYGTAHVTVLNSWALSAEQNLTATSLSAIKTWITNDLAAANNAKFRIVMLHHPAYALQTDAVSTKVLSEWVPLLEAGGVDLVLCGHQHIYSRSYSITGGAINNSSGITYVMGNSGQQFYTDANTTYQAKTIYNTSTYQIVDIDGNNLNLYTYDRDRNLLDSWSTTSKVADLTGDVDGNGKVDMDDVNAIFNAYINCEDYDSYMDVNNDNAVDIRDAQLVLKIYLSSIS